jgi:hypothetical protein
MAQRANELYESFEKAETYYNLGALKHFNFMEKHVIHKWNTCFNEFEPKLSNSNTAKICNETTTTVRDFITSLGRNTICIDDIRSILSNKHKFRVIYTDNDTYLAKDPDFEPSEEVTGEGLFQW